MVKNMMPPTDYTLKRLAFLYLRQSIDSYVYPPEREEFNALMDSVTVPFEWKKPVREYTEGELNSLLALMYNFFLELPNREGILESKEEMEYMEFGT
jgi:hypothetical protein